MKRTTLLAFSVVLALIIGIVSSGSMADAVKPTNPPDSSVCPADKVQHWYTPRITQSLSFIELRSPTGPTIFNGDQVWIQVHHGSDDIIDFHSSIIDRLTELGYEAFNLDTQTSEPLLDSFSWISIAFEEPTSHAIICADI